MRVWYSFYLYRYSGLTIPDVVKFFHTGRPHIAQGAIQVNGNGYFVDYINVPFVLIRSHFLAMLSVLKVLRLTRKKLRQFMIGLHLSQLVTCVAFMV